MPTNVYAKTRKTYDALGRPYVLSIEPLVPKERKTFAAKLVKGSRVLEVGCAGGRDAAFFAKQGLHVIGIDTSRVLLNIARKRVPRAKFVYMDVRKMKFSPQSFDAIWANAVLLHLQRKDIPSVLRRFHKVLVPGGRLHIRVKLGQGSAWVTDKLSSTLRYFSYFTKREMEELLRQAGFRVASSRVVTDQAKRREVRWLSIEANKARGLVK